MSLFIPSAFQEGGVGVLSITPSALPRHSRNDFITLTGFKEFMSIYREILEVYYNFDRTIASFRSATGMQCPPGCSLCCREWPVETTVLEVLPLAREIYLREEDDAVMSAIFEKDQRNDPSCVLIKNTLSEGDAGVCGYYEFRPLVCRLFGFAGRRNKHSKIELMPCRIVKESAPAEVKRAEMALLQGLSLPVYQDAFMRIFYIKPNIGSRRLPINQALKEAIETLFWSRPVKGQRFRRAAGF